MPEILTSINETAESIRRGADRVLRGEAWSLVSTDPEIELELAGQFPLPDGAEIEGTPSLSTTSGSGSSRPSVQWVAGGLRVVRFSSYLVSRNQAHSIDARYRALLALDRYDPTLGRAPRLSFQWGDLVVAGYATVRKRIGAWWPLSGLIRRVDFEISITESNPVDLSSLGERSDGETQYLTLGEGEILEALAARKYGDPLRGELVRRVNPEIAEAELAGARVKLLERTHPAMIGRVRPTSPAFAGLELDGSGDVGAVLGELYRSRGVEVLGSTWSALQRPE